MLFEKLSLAAHREPRGEKVVIPTSWGVITREAAWPPRTAQRCTQTPDGNMWLLGGHGVRPLGISGPAGLPANKSKQEEDGKSKAYNPISSYQHRHVELDGRMVPLRALDYGRLPDVWLSPDQGRTWKLGGFGPFGARSYFGVGTSASGTVFVFGGVEQIDGSSSLHRNDVWSTTDGSNWQQLPFAAWSPRASFATVDLPKGVTRGEGKYIQAPDGSILLCGGRLADGNLLNSVWQGFIRKDDIEWIELADAPWSPRSDAVATYGLGSVWILGGRSERGYMGDVWRSPGGGRWLQQEYSAPWKGSVGMTALFLPIIQDSSGAKTDTLVVIGGYGTLLGGEGRRPDDVVTSAWALTDQATGQWSVVGSLPEYTPRAHQCILPASRASTSSPANDGHVIMFGGLTKEGYYSNDIWSMEVRATDKSSIPPPDRSTYDRRQLAEEREKSEAAAAAAPSMEDTPTTSLLVPMFIVLFGLQVAAVSFGAGVYQMTVNSRWAQGGAALALAVGITGPLAVYTNDVLTSLPTAFPTTESTTSKVNSADLASKAAEKFERSLAAQSHSLQIAMSVQAGDRHKAGGYNAWGGPNDMGFAGGSPVDTNMPVYCRTPVCSRDPSCAWDPQAGMNATRGTMCCNDLLYLMLEDLTAWFDSRDIPYYLMYGTLLGAVRDHDILPHTRDVDVVVPKEYWHHIQNSLSQHKFAAGRAYNFGIDPWEDKVGRICADYADFPGASLFGGDDFMGEGKVEYHFDVYAADWWQVEELTLEDCVEPLGMTTYTF